MPSAKSIKTAKDKKRFKLFDLESMPWEIVTTSPFRETIESYAVGRVSFKIPVRGEGREGLMMSVAHFPPYFYTPRHSHDADHIALILDGEQHFGRGSGAGPATNWVKKRGNMVLTKGQGYFVKAETMYGPFWAGPKGLVFAEFRSVSQFGTTYSDLAEVERLCASRDADLAEEMKNGS